MGSLCGSCALDRVDDSLLNWALGGNGVDLLGIRDVIFLRRAVCIGGLMNEYRLINSPDNFNGNETMKLSTVCDA